jgi:predicted cobalt transporter CbtA
MLDERTRRADEVGELLDTVKAYARQETVGPLEGAGRAVAFGVAGVVCLGIGVIIMLVGVLRLLQTESSAFDGQLMSALPYLIVLAVAAGFMVAALSLIKRVNLDGRKRAS